MWNRQAVTKILRKGYYDLRLRSAAAGVFALVWWGLLYPELCFTDGTWEHAVVVDGQESVAKGTDCQDILAAEADEVVIGSRLLEWLEQKISKE